MNLLAYALENETVWLVDCGWLVASAAHGILMRAAEYS